MSHIITKKKIEDVFSFSEAVKEKKELASEYLRTAQDRYKEDLITVPAGEGREEAVEMTEADAWKEVYQLGAACLAGQELKKRHKKVFEAFKASDKAGNEYHAYVLEHFGVDFRNMEFADTLKVLIGVVDQRMNEHLGTKSK